MGESMGIVERDRETVVTLAEVAREFWDALDVDAPRDRWVNRDDDASVLAWAFERGLL